jgi:hypothetical protein
MTVDTKVEEYLKVMLNGYTQSIQQVNDYISNTENQLKGALSQKEEMLDKIAELEGILGIEEEEDDADTDSAEESTLAEVAE